MKSPVPVAEAPGGKIITFYSYKGGTGRTMLLANVAWILATNGKRVLVVDWDLEAPGAHRYFAPFLLDPELTSSPGVIDMMSAFAVGAMTKPKNPAATQQDWYHEIADVLEYAVSLTWENPRTGRRESPFKAPGLLDLLPAGRQGPGYALQVTSFDWNNFYERLGGGAFLAAVRASMRKEYDYILIDSRTGVSDTSGICTVQLPDQVVVCFTLNNQSIEGASGIGHSIMSQRTESSFRIFPVPTRVEEGEKEKLERARDLAHDRFEPFLAGSVQPARQQRYWADVEQPYKKYYAYEEILAVFGDRPDEANSLLAPCERVAALVAGTPGMRLIPVDEVERLFIRAKFERRPAPVLPEGERASRSATVDVDELEKEAPTAALGQTDWRQHLPKLIIASIALSMVVMAVYALKGPSGGDGDGPPPSSADAGAGIPDAGVPTALPRAQLIDYALLGTSDHLVRVALLTDPDAKDVQNYADLVKRASDALPLASLRPKNGVTASAYYAAESVADDVVYTGGPAGVLERWKADGNGGSLQRKLGSPILKIAAGRDQIAVTTADGELKLFDPVSLEPRRTLLPRKGIQPDVSRRQINSVAFDSTFGCLVAAGQLDEVVLWSSAGGGSAFKLETQFTPKDQTPVSAGFAGAGCDYLYVYSPFKVSIWHPSFKDEKEAKVSGPFALMPNTVAQNQPQVTTVEFSTAGDAVAYAMSDQRVFARRLDKTLKQAPSAFVTGPVPVTAIALNQRWLAVGTASGNVYVWRWNQKTQTYAFDQAETRLAHAKRISKLEIDEGDRLVSASDAGTARIDWLSPADAPEVPDTRDTQGLPGKSVPITSVELRREGKRLVLGDSEEVRVYELGADKKDPTAMLARVGICLTIEQRRTLLSESPREATDAFTECEAKHGRTPTTQGSPKSPLP